MLCKTAARAADIDFAALARIVTPLRAQNLVRTMGVRRSDLVEPYHDRVREAVVERLPPEERKRLHGRLALALEASGEADPEALAVHFEGSGDLIKASEYAESAADAAAQKLAFDRAAQLLAEHREVFRPPERGEHVEQAIALFGPRRRHGVEPGHDCLGGESRV